jgi:hypothetical protein
MPISSAVASDEAVPKLLLSIQEDPSDPLPYRYLAACYAHMGRLDEAREIIAQLRAITPVVAPDASNFRNAEQRELHLSGLQLAMGEGNEPNPQSRRARSAKRQMSALGRPPRLDCRPGGGLPDNHGLGDQSTESLQQVLQVLHSPITLGKANEGLRRRHGGHETQALPPVLQPDPVCRRDIGSEN